MKSEGLNVPQDVITLMQSSKSHETGSMGSDGIPVFILGLKK